jgi:hypothetical protein
VLMVHSAKALEKLFISRYECGTIGGGGDPCHPYQLLRNHVQSLFSLLFAEARKYVACTIL